MPSTSARVSRPDAARGQRFSRCRRGAAPVAASVAMAERHDSNAERRSARQKGARRGAAATAHVLACEAAAGVQRGCAAHTAPLAWLPIAVWRQQPPLASCTLMRCGGVAKLEMRHPAARRGSRGHLARAQRPRGVVAGTASSCVAAPPTSSSARICSASRRVVVAWGAGDAAAMQRSYAAACDALTALITAHYRPTGYDAAATFGKLREWLQARHSASTWCVVRLTSHCRAQLLELEDAVNKLSVVHVAGTKGKVSRAPLLRRLPAPC